MTVVSLIEVTWRTLACTRRGVIDLDDLLAKTSRTFALAIPLLPEPTRRSVSIAYLLFRIADTFEDATAWSRADRITALRELAALLDGPNPSAQSVSLTQRWLATPPVTQAGYLELLSKTPAVLAEVEATPEPARRILLRHAVRTAEGMAAVVARGDERGNLRLGSVKDLKDYCYIVAGIVGELLTDVFLADAPSLDAERAVLTRTMAAFGEGLQLVNILKDASDDARDGRVYLPAATSRADVFALARADLDAAAEYVAALQRGRAPRGFLGFTGLSLVLARASLARLEQHGPGAKVSRDDVARLFGALQQDLESGAQLDLRALA